MKYKWVIFYWWKFNQVTCYCILHTKCMIMTVKMLGCQNIDMKYHRTIGQYQNVFYFAKNRFIQHISNNNAVFLIRTVKVSNPWRMRITPSSDISISLPDIKCLIATAKETCLLTPPTSSFSLKYSALYNCQQSPLWFFWAIDKHMFLKFPNFATCLHIFSLASYRSIHERITGPNFLICFG